MAGNEFKEIHEAWTELIAIFDEIEALNAKAAVQKIDVIAHQKASA